MERESVLAPVIPGMRADARFRGVATSPMWVGGGGKDHKEFQCQGPRNHGPAKSVHIRGTAVVNAIPRLGSHLL